MMRPHPPRLRMKRRKTVWVTPAIGARTVAGEMVTVPMERLVGTGFRYAGSPTDSAVSSRAGAPAPHVPFPELSQNFFTVLFYLSPQSKSPRRSEGSVSGLIRSSPQRKKL